MRLRERKLLIHSANTPDRCHQPEASVVWSWREPTVPRPPVLHRGLGWKPSARLPAAANQSSPPKYGVDAQSSLACIRSAFTAAASGGLHRLAIEDGRYRLWSSACLLSHKAPQPVVQALPNAKFAPRAKAIDGWPRRIVSRQRAPRAVRLCYVENRIDRQAHIRCAISATRFGRWNQRFDILPFPVGEVAWIELVAHPAMLPKLTGDFYNTL
jgi:hypothetical protein